jgi:positive regulator of sigma E activity
MLLAMGLTHVLASMVYVSKSWSVVLILAGYAIPFVIARQRVAKRMRNFETNEHKLSDGEG